MDADCIYVMGDGCVLEAGTHEELLENDDGPYARLVNMQRLRERTPGGAHGDEDDTTLGEGRSELGKTLKDSEIADEPLAPTLSRRMTSTSGRSVTSDAAERLRNAGLEFDNKEYSLFYLFRRMGSINRDSWRLYLAGCVFATSKRTFHPRLRSLGR